MPAVHSFSKPAAEPRTGIEEAAKRKKEKENLQKNPQQQQQQQRLRKQVVQEISDSIVVRCNNVSLDSTCSSDSCSSKSMSVKKVNSTTKTSNASATSRRRNARCTGFKPARVVPDAAAVSPPSNASAPPKKCDWITPNSDPLYSAFHDEEWGVPVVHDDRKLFELLVFSQALAEHTWPSILSHRDMFRHLFENFAPSSIAQFTEKELLTPKINGKPLLSEPKLRAIVENAKQLLKVQQEFGSFSNYCWRFVSHKPIRNEFRYGRQVPVKTPKAELISKDMMRRGFQCVGPTVVYSFMQVAGLVNDHLVTCFRFHECSNVTLKNEFKTEVKEKKVENETVNLTKIQ
ncbi:uncharacterized protein LOC130727718 isoform X2 [Lotus japonicus]|uniref:uncharacterized protein LOC130727718 isoform X2 n=1 Tax=Lotus japonicus TaxID=34305 RepID=UPI0025832444|nr:uncharacterized protein LOC130727718 isoform X2 [Lotus japonicus]